MAKTKTRGTVQIWIGIVTSVLLMISVAANLLSVHNEQMITGNRQLLIQLGYDPDIFQRSASYWLMRYGFHALGLVGLLLYLISTYLKNFKASASLFTLCLFYFIICAISDMTALTYEEKVRGLTLGAWVAKVISWIPKYAIELGLLSQGFLGVRKYRRNETGTANQNSTSPTVPAVLN